MVKYHTDAEITLECMEHRAYPIAVVQEMLNVEPRKNIINGLINTSPDGIQPPKSIIMMANALGYSNPAIDAKSYGSGEVGRIKKKMDSQLIMENVNVRGPMIPKRLSSKSKLEQQQLARTVMLQSKLDKDSADNKELDIAESVKSEKVKKKRVVLKMAGFDTTNPGELGITNNRGMTATTNQRIPSLFTPSKEKRQEQIIQNEVLSASSAGVKIDSKKIKKRPVGRAPRGTLWDSNRGMFVADPNYKGMNFFEKKEGESMREADYEAQTERRKERIKDDGKNPYVKKVMDDIIAKVEVEAQSGSK